MFLLQFVALTNRIHMGDFVIIGADKFASDLVLSYQATKNTLEQKTCYQ